MIYPPLFPLTTAAVYGNIYGRYLLAPYSFTAHSMVYDGTEWSMRKKRDNNYWTNGAS